MIGVYTLEPTDDVILQLFEDLELIMKESEVKFLDVCQGIPKHLNFRNLIVQEFLIDVGIKKSSRVRRTG